MTGFTHRSRTLPSVVMPAHAPKLPHDANERGGHKGTQTGHSTFPRRLDMNANHLPALLRFERRKIDPVVQKKLGFSKGSRTQTAKLSCRQYRTAISRC
jgi:hypothetical protein